MKETIAINSNLGILEVISSISIFIESLIQAYSDRYKPIIRSDAGSDAIKSLN